MGLLDGEIADLVGNGLIDAGLSKPAVLIKITPTVRDPSHVTASSAPTTVSHQCAGFVARLETYLFRNTLIVNANRVVKIYGTTLGSIVPTPGDRITIEGVTGTIVDDAGGLKAVQRDPAGAIYTCQTT